MCVVILHIRIYMLSRRREHVTRFNPNSHSWVLPVLVCRRLQLGSTCVGVQVFDGWVLKGEKFPSSQDHPLPIQQRYTDYCSSGSAGGATRSSQNVAMLFFRIHSPDSGFTLTVRKLHNPFRECLWGCGGESERECGSRR